ncbi:UNVERIFIED_CONTAM: hypothetical protein GTU68_049953 [Idotea baltica]|nr:hypothetical protein [Idotea baltica]
MFTYVSKKETKSVFRYFKEL